MKENEKIVTKLLIGLALSSGFLYLTFRGLDFNSVVNSLTKVNYYYLLLMFLVYLITYTLRALRWKIIISKIKTINIKALFTYLMAGFFINNVLPMRAGELYRAVVLGSQNKISKSTSLASIVIERTSDGILFLAILVISFSIVEMPKFVINGIYAVIVFIFLLLTFIIISVKFRNKFKNIISCIPVSEKRKNKIDEILQNFINGLEIVTSFKRFIAIISVSSIIWLCEIVLAFILVNAFGFKISFPQTIFIVAALGIGVMIPFAPGYVGTYEYAGKTALLLLGVEQNNAVSFVLTLHAFQVIFIALFGFPSLMSNQFKWNQLNKKNMEE
ncbi:MAG: lysylphosphatidylglycerol synthase transmembrane domain-containing protein [bacterium]